MTACDLTTPRLWRDQLERAHAVRSALEAAGVEFIERNGGGPGVRLRDPAPSRRPSPSRN